MTKINKLGKSTFVIAILSFILVAVLAFGGTYAYFGAKSEKATGTVQLGHIKIGTAAAFGTADYTTQAKAVPGEQIIDANEGTVSVGIDSNVKFFVRAHVSYEVAVKDTATHTDEDGCADKDVVVLLLGLGTDDATIEGVWEESSDIKEAREGANGADISGEGYYYLTTAQAASATETTIKLNITAQVNPKVGQVYSQHFMDATITITVEFEAIQADYIISGTNLPETNTAVEVSKLEAAWTAALEPLTPADPEGN